MEAKEALLKARNLIKQQEYDKARRILEGTNHPKAKEWLQKLDAMRGKQSSGIKSRQHEKGAEIKTYGLDFMTVGVRIFSGIIVIPITIAMTTEIIESPPESIFARILYIGLILLIVAVGLFAITSVIAAFINKPRFIIYENGLGYTTRKQETFRSWKQIEAVQGNLLSLRILIFSIPVAGQYKIFADDEIAFELGALTNTCWEIYEHINKLLIQTQVPRMLKQIEQGETVSFMEMKVNKDGLTLGKQHLPLAEVKEVENSDGLSMVYQTNGRIWIQNSLDDAYNPIVFQALVHTLISK